MSGLAAGELDREVTIQQLTESRGPTGFPVEAWSDVECVFMARRDASGSETLRSGGLNAQVQTVWTLQYRDDMDPEVIDVQKKRRLVANGRPYDIVFGRQIGREEGIELMTIASSKVA